MLYSFLILLSDILTVVDEEQHNHLVNSAKYGYPFSIWLDWDPRPPEASYDWDGEWLWAVSFGCAHGVEGSVPWSLSVYDQ